METEIFAAIDSGKNIFVTGKAGTGKSTLLKNIIAKYSQDKLVFSVAPTGVAAVNIGGVTFHSYLGIHANVETCEEMRQATKFNKYIKDRFLQTEMLVIDEISMISGDFLENASQFISQVRNKLTGQSVERPFGGIQVLMFGDFFQLPPIMKKKVSRYADDVTCKFAFESPIWSELAQETFQLTRVYRQADKVFSAVLGGIREFIMYKSDLRMLEERASLEAPDDAIRLVCVNEIANRINSEKLAALAPLPRYVFKAKYKGFEGLFDKLKDDMKALQLEEITYKPGARVMLRRNVDQGRKLVNGSLGYVKTVDVNGCLVVKMDGHDEPIPFPAAIWSYKRKPLTKYERQFVDGEGFIQAEVQQMPFTFAWAISIHKSQGITLEKAEINLDRCFEDHQVYVALSRLRSIEGLYLKNFSMDKIHVNRKVKRYYESLKANK